MDIKNPKEWLELLKTSIDRVECKINNVNAPFDDTIKRFNKLLKQAIIGHCSVFWVGNGGSAAICSHLSQDLMNKLSIKSHYLNDPSLMTCMANDFGYEQVYARPLTLHASENDILIAISSSGNSDNILNAIKVAKNKNMQIITLSGLKEDNVLWNSQADLAFFISSSLYGIVEMSHEAILHGIIETLWLEIRET
ncbi:MAG: SIS domain-containing protein [Pseudomonadota bacterium]